MDIIRTVQIILCRRVYCISRKVRVEFCFRFPTGQNSCNRGAVLLSVSPPLFAHVLDVELRAARNTCPESIPDSPQSTLDTKLYLPWFFWHNSVIVGIESTFQKLTRNCTAVHCSEGSLKSSSREAPIRAESEPKR